MSRRCKPFDSDGSHDITIKVNTMNKYMIGLVIGLLCNNTFANGNNNQARAKLYNKDGKVLGSVEFSQYKEAY